jgi:hypothetical protein
VTGVNVFQVEVEKDKVVLALGGRLRDLLLSCAQAERLSAALRTAAGHAGKEPPAVVRAEAWDLKVESYDGKVALRFTAPVNNTAAPGRVPMPPGVARRLADVLDLKRSQAEVKMRLVFQRPRGIPRGSPRPSHTG